MYQSNKAGTHLTWEHVVDSRVQRIVFKKKMHFPSAKSFGSTFMSCIRANEVFAMRTLLIVAVLEYLVQADHS